MAKQTTLAKYHTVLSNTLSMVTHIAKASYGWMSLYTNELSQRIREKGLLENKELCDAVDAMCKGAHKMHEVIYRSTSTRMEQATYPYLYYGQDEYFIEGRLIPITHQLINEYCKTEIDALQAIVRKTVYEYSNAEDKDMMVMAVMLHNWATFYRLGADKCMKEFKQIIGGTQKMVAPPLVTLHLNIAKGAAANSHKIIMLINGMEDEAGNEAQEAYHEAQDNMAHKIVHGKYDREFRLRGIEYTLHDWLDYWVARVTNDTLASNGKLPEQVEREIANLEAMGQKPIRANFLRLISKLSKEVGKTDDVRDYADYISEHRWKVTDDIYNICFNEISKGIE